MSTTEIASKVQALRELRRMAEELAGEIEAIQDEIKSEMTARSVDEITGADYKISWKEVKNNRFDSVSFKNTHGDLYAQYTKQTTSRRFTIV